MKKKILTAYFCHETNSFSPFPADREAYMNYRFEVGSEVFEKNRGVGTGMGAFMSVFENRDDIELIPTVALSAIPSGPVTADVYDFVVEKITDAVKKHRSIDGVLLYLHGAMVAEGHDDGEGDLLEIIRNLVGYDIPVIASLDLHANITAKMARLATALIPYNKYPHTDIFETSLFAAQMMADTLDGKIVPVMAYRRVPYLLPLTPSEFSGIKPLYNLVDEINKRKDVLCTRFHHGFFPADIEEMGMAVTVITDNNVELAQTIADEFKFAIEENIANFRQKYPSLDEALDMALLPGDGPLVIADASDNPGAGGLGDTTHILRRILERKITGAVVACIVDPASVDACVKSGVGTTVKLTLGGWSNPEISGGPLEVDAYIKMLSDGKYILKGEMLCGSMFNHGKTAVTEIAGNIVIITSLCVQPYDLEIFRSHGILPEEQKILVTKSTIHYRASYGTVARKMVSVVLPGYSNPLPDGYKFRKWKA